MSKPESETDPWAKVRTFDVSTYGDCRMERDYYGEIASEQKYQRGEYAWVDEVDAARAAEATQHQQEIAAKEESHERVEALNRHALECQRQRAEAAEASLAAVEAERDELWGSNHLNANALRLCQAERDNQYAQAVEATQRALLAEQALANVEAERDRMKAALEFYANPFGRLDSNGERVTVPDFYAEMEFGGIARAALTPQGQSTDGETR